MKAKDRCETLQMSDLWGYRFILRDKSDQAQAAVVDAAAERLKKKQDRVAISAEQTLQII